MADIEAGQVDIVVVYKVDRLTRALSDFAKLVEVFDRHEVSFVSITQQFNTTTSMGRLTLNVLLSFAQFEREVIGERVRDKIAASKKKGMWMGGMPSLGYNVRDRKLIVNEDEARTVRYIFERYLQLRSVRELKEDLAPAGIRSKPRTRPDGTVYGGQILGRGALYQMLQNRIYRGEITHKGGAYPGQHPAIIDQGLWDQVQALLAANRVDQSGGLRASQPSLLTGLLFDATGERLTPTHAVKKGTRYRYYVSASLTTGTRTADTDGWRIPAANLEDLVIGRLCSLLRNPAELLAIVGEAACAGIGTQQLMARAGRIAEDLTNRSAEKRSLVINLIARVEVDRDSIQIAVARERLTSMLQGEAIRPPGEVETHANNPNEIVTLTIAARLQRVGRKVRMVVPDANDQRPPDPALLRVLARAHAVQIRLVANPGLSVHDVARSEKVTAAYLYSILRLPWLAPDITDDIINGRQPPRLTARKLIRLSVRLPTNWADQRRVLGFPQRELANT